MFHEYFMKRQWLLSLGINFKWLALRLRLVILCMITDSIFYLRGF